MEDVTRVPEDEASAIGRRGFGRMLLAAGAAVTLPLLAAVRAAEMTTTTAMTTTEAPGAEADSDSA